MTDVASAFTQGPEHIAAKVQQAVAEFIAAVEEVAVEQSYQRHPGANEHQRRCWTLTITESHRSQCWLFNGHPGDHHFGRARA